MGIILKNTKEVSEIKIGKDRWVVYYRVHFVEGSIDFAKVVFGSSPNQASRTTTGFEAKTWVRLNGRGFWFSLVKLPSTVIREAREFRSIYDAKEFFDKFIF